MAADVWDEIREDFEGKIKEAKEDLEVFSVQLQNRINKAKDDLILVELGKLNRRLDDIEARLPEREES